MGPLLLVLPLVASAQEGRGFAEVRATWSVGADGFPVQVVERVRPTFEKELSERVKLTTTVEAGFAQGRDSQAELERAISESDLAPWLDLAGCTWPEEDNPFLGISSGDDYLSVERLYVDYYGQSVDLRVGRQALNWGSALFVNPTDPFPELLVTEPWKPRSGVNAVRATVPIGDLHQVQAVVGTDDDFRHPRIATRATVNALQTDFSAIGAWREEADEVLVGGDVRGTLGVGFWVEGAAHLPTDGRDPWEEVAVGVDYSFAVLERLIVAAQYYRNGAGATDPDDYAAAFGPGGVAGPDCGPDADFLGGEGEARAFAPLLSAKNYALASVAVSFTQDVSVNVAALQNLDDGTGTAIPTVSLRPNGWLELSLSGQIPYAAWGEGGEFKPRPQDLHVEVPVVPDAPPIALDLSGMVPDATLTFWTRASF